MNPRPHPARAARRAVAAAVAALVLLSGCSSAPDDGPTRCRTSVLVHELGHVVLGDGDHADPRWALVPAVAAMACAGP